MASLNVITKPFSRPEACLTSVPTTLVTTVSTFKTPHSLLSLPPKLIRLFHLSSWSSSSWVSLKTRTSRTALVPLLAQTSDWARLDEEEEEQEGGFSWDSEGGQETEASGSEGVWEGDVEEFGEGNEGSEDTFSEPPKEAKLFVGNLPFDVDHDRFAKLFNRAGVVEIAEVIFDRVTGRSRGFGFVTMKTVEEAEKAIQMFNRYEWNGRYLTVNKAAPRGPHPGQPRQTIEPKFRLYVGNLPWQVDDARLEQMFSEHGKVVDARVVYDRDTQRSRGFGFVTMSSETELKDAIAALDGQSLDGRAIKVNVAEDQRRGSF